MRRVMISLPSATCSANTVEPYEVNGNENGR